MREATGTAEWAPERGGRYVAKITMPNGTRKREEMVDADGNFLFTDRQRDKVEAKECAQEISEARRRLANADAVHGMSTRPGTTVESFGQMWTSGELLRKFGEVRKLKKKRSAADDRLRLNTHVYPYIGHMPVAAVTEEHVWDCMVKAWAAFERRWGKPPSQATKRQVYMVMHRLFSLSIRPGRLRKDNPVTEDVLPAKEEGDKIYSYLYPSELLALLGCVDVPIERRVYYALACYTGLRKGSIAVNKRPAKGEAIENRVENFRWSEIDLEHRTIISLHNKTGGAIMFAQEDDSLSGVGSLIDLLRRWREYCGWPPDSAPVIKTLRCKARGEAAALRTDLLLAGIKRGVLFSNTPQIQALRFHDLRATFVTWAKRAGKSDTWITDRSGPVTPSVMARYNRAARTVQDLFMKPGPFPDISLAIPELAQINVSRLSTRRR